MTEKPVSITEFKSVDKASEAFRRVAASTDEAATRMLATLRRAAEENR